MNTSIFVSTEFDDTTLIAKDLLGGLTGPLPEPALALLFCDSNVDVAALLPVISDTLGIPLIGSTTMGFPFADKDHTEISAALLIIRKDNIQYSITVSEPLEQTDAERQIKKLYEEGRSRLGGPVRIIMPFFPLMPELRMDDFINALFEVAGDIPVFGGVSTNDLISTEAAVFVDGRVLPDRMALLMIGGDVQPVFAVGNSISLMTDAVAIVTEAEGSKVKKINDQTFCDYMRNIGIAPEDRINGVDAMTQYGPLPVKITSKDTEFGDVPEIRCMSYTDLNEGSAVFAASIPVGAKINFGILTRDNVAESTHQCVEKLGQKMRKKSLSGYKFDVILCLSCVARYFVMAGGVNREQQALAKSLPDDVCFNGFYSFAEVCPTYLKNHTLRNRSHSAAIAMLAF